MATLPLSDIVSVSVVVSPVAAARSGFNLGLIVGNSAVISATERIRLYSDLNAMIADGFAANSPEYLAAQLYFAQNPRPQKVAVGRWDNANETAVQAITACRVKNTDWYACMICGAQKADILAVAAYIETAEPKSVFFYTTADADVKAGTDGNVMKELKASSYSRTLGQYSTYPDAVAAIMGYAMGANTGVANSAYTLAYKQEVGVTPEALTLTEVATIKGQNGNVYVNRGNVYNLFEQGVMANGQHFDEVLGLDMLVNDILLSVMDLLTGVSKVPQTEGGTTLLVNAIAGPCNRALNRGFIAPGVWNAAPVLSLNTGDMLSQGYLILSETIDSQPQADRDARIAPPIYVCVKLAGAIEHVVISVQVNR
jgi:predicted heme/steroid binding protein